MWNTRWLKVIFNTTTNAEAVCLSRKRNNFCVCTQATTLYRESGCDMFAVCILCSKTNLFLCSQAATLYRMVSWVYIACILCSNTNLCVCPSSLATLCIMGVNCLQFASYAAKQTFVCAQVATLYRTVSWVYIACIICSNTDLFVCPSSNTVQNGVRCLYFAFYAATPTFCVPK